MCIIFTDIAFQHLFLFRTEIENRYNPISSFSLSHLSLSLSLLFSPPFFSHFSSFLPPSQPSLIIPHSTPLTSHLSFSNPHRQSFPQFFFIPSHPSPSPHSFKSQTYLIPPDPQPSPFIPASIRQYRKRGG